jgi:hypothetical protein
MGAPSLCGLLAFFVMLKLPATEDGIGHFQHHIYKGQNQEEYHKKLILSTMPT